MKNLKISSKLSKAIAATVATTMCISGTMSSTVIANGSFDQRSWYHSHVGSNDAVYTEVWTSVYDVNGEPNPYLKCVFSVYPDGCASARAFNTYEWDSYLKDSFIRLPFMEMTVYDSNDIQASLATPQFIFKQHNNVYNLATESYETLVIPNNNKEYINDFSFVDCSFVQHCKDIYIPVHQPKQVSEKKSPRCNLMNTATGQIYSGSTFGIESYYGDLSKFAVGEVDRYEFVIDPDAANEWVTFSVFGHKIEFRINEYGQPDIYGGPRNCIQEAYWDSDTFVPAKYIGTNNPESDWGNYWTIPISQQTDDMHSIYPIVSYSSNLPDKDTWRNTASNYINANQKLIMSIKDNGEYLPYITGAEQYTPIEYFPEPTVAQTTIQPSVNTTTVTTTTITPISTTTVSTINTIDRIDKLEKEIDEIKTNTSDIDNRLQSLEQEYAKLIVACNSIINNKKAPLIDVNDDNIIDSTDVEEILIVYAIKSTGDNIKTYSDFVNYKNK